MLRTNETLKQLANFSGILTSQGVFLFILCCLPSLLSTFYDKKKQLVPVCKIYVSVLNTDIPPCTRDVSWLDVYWIKYSSLNRNYKAVSRALLRSLLSEYRRVLFDEKEQAVLFFFKQKDKLQVSTPAAGWIITRTALSRECTSKKY